MRLPMAAHHLWIIVETVENEKMVEDHVPQMA